MPTVLITGANRGIGLELTKRYLHAGDRVLACCRNPGAASELNDLVRDSDVAVHELQVSDKDSVAALPSKLGATSIDILINNAGTIAPPRGRANSVEYGLRRLG